MSALSRRGVCWCWFAVASLVVGCSSKSMTPAPVEDREMAAVKVAPVVDVKPPVVKQPPGFENAGKPGYYTVKAGDTLIRIGLEHGQSHRDLTRWNNLENPNKIEVGQVLRVQAPVLTETAAVTRPVVTSSVSASPIPAIGTATATAGSTAVTPGKASNGMVAAPSPAASTPAPAPAPASAVGGEDELAWIWPGNGAVLGGFDEVKNKGIDIGGVAGDPVVAAADGRVVYAGSGLRGYGNLIILKHNATYLSAYAHNQTLAVKEDQAVKKGQKIAEMGNTDADRVKLHFEVRRQGKPVDPAKYLPPR